MGSGKGGRRAAAVCSLLASIAACRGGPDALGPSSDPRLVRLLAGDDGYPDRNPGLAAAAALAEEDVIVN